MTGRHYKIDGQRLASVTTILNVLDKAGLAQWRGNVGNLKADEISRDAADHGTAVHAFVERYNRGDHGPFGAPIDTILQPYIAWFKAEVSCVLAAEKLVVSRRHKFAGTADIVVVMKDGSHAVVDLKTSRTSLSEDAWGLQTSAYALALSEEGIECRRRIIVRLPKSVPGALYVTEFDPEELEVDQRAFLACLRIFHWKSTRTPSVEVSKAMRIKMRRNRVQ